MSFILDALKKSENERQGQRGLGVADVPMASEAPRAPAWMWWLLGLLGVNLVVLMVVLLRPAQETAPAAEATDAATETAARPADTRTTTPVERPAEARAATVPERVAPELAAVVDRARTERERTVPSTPTTAGDGQTGQRTAAATPELSPPQEEEEDGVRGDARADTPTQTSEPQPSPDAVAQRPAGGSGEALSLPTLDELRVRGDTGLPDLHLDIHVWSEQPRGRFVYVNTVKYREGDALSEGPRVSSIVPEGVVLEQNGRRFLLPRD